MIGVPQTRTEALIQRLASLHDGTSGPPGLIARLVAGFQARDAGRWSEVFEPSISLDATGWHLFRFSYAFPGFREDTEACSLAIRALCAPFGVQAVRAARSLILAPAERESCVVQPIVGATWDGPDAWRVKFYLQFDERAAESAIAVASRMLGAPTLIRRFAGRSLHMLCMDLGPNGLVGAKLYFMETDVALAEFSARVGPCDLLGHLERTGRTRLAEVLAIHRVRGSGDAGLEDVSEIDLPLAGNGLRWSDVSGCASLAAAGIERSPLAAVASEFLIAPRRLSVAIGPERKLNVYYVLAEGR